VIISVIERDPEDCCWAVCVNDAGERVRLEEFRTKVTDPEWPGKRRKGLGHSFRGYIYIYIHTIVNIVRGTVRKCTIFTSLRYYRFDATKSTKGASKLRRDLINAEIANLRDLLPLPPSTRQRLSQLQLMALVCVYVRKANYFQQGKKISRPYIINVRDEKPNYSAG